MNQSIARSKSYWPTVQAVLEYLHEAQKECKKAADLRIYVSGEFDSNQTKFERRSNNGELAVVASKDTVLGQAMLFLVRIIVDAQPSLMEYAAEEFGEEDEDDDSEGDDSEDGDDEAGAAEASPSKKRARGAGNDASSSKKRAHGAGGEISPSKKKDTEKKTPKSQPLTNDFHPREWVRAMALKESEFVESFDLDGPIVRILQGTQELSPERRDPNCPNWCQFEVVDMDRSKPSYQEQQRKQNNGEKIPTEFWTLDMINEKILALLQ